MTSPLPPTGVCFALRQKIKNTASPMWPPSEDTMTQTRLPVHSRPTRRQMLKSAALGSAAAVAAPYVKGVYAAGSLSLGVWDHWVPGANNTLTKLCNEWGAKNNCEIRIDYITSQGEKDKLTAAAEAQAGTGHDIMSHRDWNVRIHQNVLEPMDDVVTQLTKDYGPMGQTSDAVDWVGALFNSFGVVMVDAKDDIKINSNETRTALEYLKKLMAVNPPEVYAWDDAGNNRWLISGKGSNIMNPPSAWAVAKRDNPQVAANCWTHPMPKGPKGRYVGQLPQFYGVWSFSKNKQAAKDLLLYISQKSSVA